MGKFAKRSKYNKVREDSENNINPENLKLLEKYKSDMGLRGLSEGTIYNYSRDITQWFVFIYEKQDNKHVKNLKEDDIEEFIYDCKKNGNNVSRIKGRMSALSAFYIYLRRKKVCIENPCEFILRPKKGRPVVVQTFLTQEQYVYMKKMLKSHGNLQLELYAMLSISTMARVNAISNITWSQIDFENRTIDDVLEKEGYIVTLYFNDEVRDLLQRLKDKREQENIVSDYVFLTMFNEKASVEVLTAWARKIGRMIGITTFHPHDFRHSGSQLMNMMGAPIELISELLGHKSTDTTRLHYLQPNKKNIKEQKDKFKL